MNPLSCNNECEYLTSAYTTLENVALDNDHLKGLNIWIGASKNETTSIRMKNLYSCVLSQLGANILNNDFDAILNERVAYDALLMFSFTAGTSARAIEIVVTSNIKKSPAKDKLHVYMPSEYSKGYISRKLGEHLISGKLIHKEENIFNKLDKNVFKKCIVCLINVANDKKIEMKLKFNPQIAILTALPKEFVKIKELMTDIRHDESLSDEKIQYPHGRIGSKDVVLAMSGMGNNLSAAVATKIYEKYPSVKYTFVVGIAGGIPDLKNPKNHVSLGDIVICDDKGILQYDMTKTKTNETEYNFSPRAPDSRLFRNSEIYVQSVGTKPYKYWEYLDALMDSNALSRPATQILDESPWIEDTLVAMPPIPNGFDANRPRIHFGPIASANTVVKDVGLRSQLKNKFGAKAVEMEASGVADAAWLSGKPCFVVRGICDYANPTKNDEWQEYAAAAAAAFTREIIEETLS